MTRKKQLVCLGLGAVVLEGYIIPVIVYHTICNKIDSASTVVVTDKEQATSNKQ